MRNLFTIIMVVILTSCRSAKVVETAENVTRDTVYRELVTVDSIYVHDSLIERYHPSAFHYDTLVQALIRTDTIYREKQKMEYRYKFLRDTTYIHRVDTIPKLVTVEKTVHERYVPPWVKYLAVVGAIALLAAAIYLFCKLRP